MTLLLLRPLVATAFPAALFGLSLSGAFAAESSLDGSRTICTHPEAALPRVVQVVYETPDTPVPCKVLYEKDGNVEEIGRAQNTTGHCEKIERKVVANLSRGGYACEHTFLGALAASDRSVTLDLFADEGVAAVSDVKNANAMGGGRAGSDIDTVPVVEPVPGSELAHEHAYTHTHSIGDAGGEPIEHTHVTTLEVSPTGDALAASGEEDGSAVSSTREESGSGSGFDTSAGTVSGLTRESTDTDRTDGEPVLRHALLSRALPNQSDAHRFAAEFRRSFPNVETRVARRADTVDGWHVALGVGADASALEEALATLGGDVGGLFDVVPLAAPVAEPESLVLVQDDWARYAVASCYAGGHRTAAEMAECANVIVDADAFVNCLGGGLCAPERFRQGDSVDAIDLAAVLGAEDPIAAARERIVTRLEGCERSDGVDDAEFAECAALAVLDDDHREIYDCYQRSASEIALIECAGTDSMVDYAMAYERCGTSGYEMSACLLDSSDNDYLESAAYCLGFEDAAEIAACSVEANLSTDDALILACLTDFSERSERATCLARERLDDTGYAAIQCGSLTESVTEYGLCVGERSGTLSHDALHAARCLDGTDASPDVLLDCAGGQFADEDIGECIRHGLDDPRCFEPETLISRVANDTIEDHLQLTMLDNEITRFRQELYALEGGDLDEVLSAEGDKAFAAIEEKVERAKGGLRGLFGFGK